MPSFSEQFERLRDCSVDQSLQYLEEIHAALALQAKATQKEARILTEELYSSLRTEVATKHEDCLELTMVAMRLVGVCKGGSEQVGELRSKVTVLERKLKEYGSAFDDVQSDLKLKEKASEDLEESLADRDRHIAALVGEVGQLKAELKKVHRELSVTKESQERVAVQMVTQGELNCVSAARDAHIQKCRNLEELLLSAEEKVGEYTRHLTSERIASDKLKQALTLAKSQGAKLRSENDEIMMTLMTYEQKIRDLEHENLKQRTQIQNMAKDPGQRRQSGGFEGSLKNIRSGSIEEELTEEFESLGGFITEDVYGQMRKMPELSINQRPDVQIIQERRPAELQLQVIAIGVMPTLRANLPMPEEESPRNRRLSTVRSVTNIVYKCVKVDIGIQTQSEKKRAMILKRFKQAEILPKKRSGKGNSNMILKTVHIAKVAPQHRPRSINVGTEAILPALTFSEPNSDTVICVREPPTMELWHSEAIHVGHWSVFEILTYSTEDDVQSQLSTPRSVSGKSRYEIRRDPTEEFFTLVPPTQTLQAAKLNHPKRDCIRSINAVKLFQTAIREGLPFNKVRSRQWYDWIFVQLSAATR